jgi:hypothetical protein
MFQERTAILEPPIIDALRNKRSEVAGLVKDLEQLPLARAATACRDRAPRAPLPLRQVRDGDKGRFSRRS